MSCTLSSAKKMYRTHSGCLLSFAPGVPYSNTYPTLAYNPTKITLPQAHTIMGLIIYSLCTYVYYYIRIFVRCVLLEIFSGEISQHTHNGLHAIYCRDSGTHTNSRKLTNGWYATLLFFFFFTFHKMFFVVYK